MDTKKKAICSGFFVLCVRISSWKLETTDGGHRQISIAFLLSLSHLLLFILLSYLKNTAAYFVHALFRLSLLSPCQLRLIILLFCSTKNCNKSRCKQQLKASIFLNTLWLLLASNSFTLFSNMWSHLNVDIKQI